MSTELASQAPYALAAELRAALRTFERQREALARRAGIEPRQHDALLAVKGFPGRDQVSIGELAERLQIRHHSAVGLVNRLEAQGLVERLPAMDDRRLVFIRLTPDAEQRLARIVDGQREELTRHAPALAHQLLAITERARANA